jgi:hypothetical protein
VAKKPWEKQESRLANVTGGTRNSGSGNGWVRKNDVRHRRRGPLQYLLEAKWTAAKSFTLKLADLKALEHNAALVSRTPAYAIEFSEKTASGHRVCRRYVVLREEDVFSDDPHLPDSA